MSLALTMKAVSERLHTNKYNKMLAREKKRRRGERKEARRFFYTSSNFEERHVKLEQRGTWDEEEMNNTSRIRQTLHSRCLVAYVVTQVSGGIAAKMESISIVGVSVYQQYLGRYRS